MNCHAAEVSAAGLEGVLWLCREISGTRESSDTQRRVAVT